MEPHPHTLHLVFSHVLSVCIFHPTVQPLLAAAEGQLGRILKAVVLRVILRGPAEEVLGPPENAIQDDTVAINGYLVVFESEQEVENVVLCLFCFPEDRLEVGENSSKVWVETLNMMGLLLPQLNFQLLMGVVVLLQEQVRASV